jgi:hypothetical protein
MKKVVLSMVCSILLLSSCLPSAEESPITNEFVVIRTNVDTGIIVVHKETRVQYFYFDRGLTVMVDKDGKPLIYKGELPNK